MLRIEGDREGHEKFKRLCALAVSGNLIPLEISELRAHLHFCEDCREVLLQYRSLTTQGMLVLADLYLERNGLNGWDDAPARDVLFSRVKADEQPPLLPAPASGGVRVDAG